MDMSNQQTFPWIQAFNKHFPRILIHYISACSEKNEVIRKAAGSLKVTLNQVSHSRIKTRRQDSCGPARMEQVLGSHLL
jgi:hypothetical protein